jgi:pimeloyl-ACP methyl ester carboxylesterase
LAALALSNYFIARRTERAHPLRAPSMEVDSVRLHYSDRGECSPIVLIHGNAVSGNDWNTSGVAELLLASHRVIIFDRPGYSGRAGNCGLPLSRLNYCTSHSFLRNCILPVVCEVIMRTVYAWEKL